MGGNKAVANCMPIIANVYAYYNYGFVQGVSYSLFWKKKYFILNPTQINSIYLIFIFTIILTESNKLTQ